VNAATPRAVTVTLPAAKEIEGRYVCEKKSVVTVDKPVSCYFKLQAPPGK
jgi:hypothetical protein